MGENKSEQRIENERETNKVDSKFRYDQKRHSSSTSTLPNTIRSSFQHSAATLTQNYLPLRWLRFGGFSFPFFIHIAATRRGWENKEESDMKGMDGKGKDDT